MGWGDFLTMIATCGMFYDIGFRSLEDMARLMEIWFGWCWNGDDLRDARDERLSELYASRSFFLSDWSDFRLRGEFLHETL